MLERPTDAVCSCRYIGLPNIYAIVQIGTDTKPPVDIVNVGASLRSILMASTNRVLTLVTEILI